MRKVTGIILALIFVSYASVNAEGVNTEEDAFTFIPVLESLRVLTDGGANIKFEVGGKEMPQTEKEDEGWHVYQDSDLLHGISFLVKELQKGQTLLFARESNITILRAGDVRVTLDMQSGSFVFLIAEGIQMVVTDEVMFYMLKVRDKSIRVLRERGRTIMCKQTPLC